MAGPLAGIRILDLTTLTQGGEATGFLCDLGAEVLKVERREGGDPGRRITPVAPGLSAFFLPQNRGKKSITLNLKAPEARTIVLQLAERCDAFAQNFRPGVAERLGLAYPDVRAVNPSIVYAEASVFGSKGPDAGRSGVDLVGQARGGLVSVTGDGSGRPAGAIISDYAGAMHLAIGILSGLVCRQQTGIGQHVRGSMLGSMISMQGWEFTHYLTTGALPRRSGTGHQLLPALYGVFQTADGDLALAGVRAEAWIRFCAVVDRPDLLHDPRFADDEARRANEAVLLPIVRAIFLQRSAVDWVKALAGVDIRCAVVQDYAQVAADPQVEANGYIASVEHPQLGTLRMAGNPLQWSETPTDLSRLAPELGEHTDSILEWLGYTDTQIEDLRVRCVV